VTTNELAEKIGIQHTSIHRRVCTTGSYYGIRPTRLVNGRLIWPDDAVEQLVAQRKAKTSGGSHEAA
jgi:hypothetical protein